MSDVQIDLELLTKQFEQGIKKATKAAEGFAKNVNGDFDGIEKGLDGLGKASKRTGDTMTKSFSTASIAFGTLAGNLAADIIKRGFIEVTSAIISFGKASLNAAVDAEETRSKFSTIFQDISSDAEDTADTLAKSFGLGAVEARRLLGDTGDLLTGFGFTQEGALGLSQQVQELAVDLASFTNFSGGAEGASQALTKALLGERESVKSLGISIQEKDVQEQIALNNAKGLTFATERQAKAQATLDIAIKQSKNAIGDYARTSGSAANQQRLFQTRVNDLQEAVGQGLVPVFQAALKQANGFLGGLDPKKLTSFVTEGIVTLIEGLITLTDYVNPVINAFKFLGNTISVIFNVAQLGLATVNTAVAKFVSDFAGRLATLESIIPDAIIPDGWSDSIKAFQEGSAEVLEETKKDIGTQVSDIGDSFERLGGSFENSISEEGLNKIRGVLNKTVEAVKSASQEVQNLPNAQATPAAAEESPEVKAKLAASQTILDIERRTQEELDLIKLESSIVEEEESARKIEDLLLIEQRKLQIKKDAQLQEVKNEKDLTKRLIEEAKIRSDFEIQNQKLVTKAKQEQNKLQVKSDKKLEQDSVAIQASLLNSTRGFLQLGIQQAKKGSKEKKALAIADATVATYLGATQAFAQVPYPANFVAAALVVGQGLANISRITSTGNFERGGIIPGGSNTGDRLTANVNSGEMILNRQQQTQLFNQANGRGGGSGVTADQIRSIVAETVASMNVVLVADDNEIARSTSRGVSNGIVIGSN